MPGLVPFLSKPLLQQPQQPTQPASSNHSVRSVNDNFLGPGRCPAQGNTSQAPIELDDDDSNDTEPIPALGRQIATTNTTSPVSWLPRHILGTDSNQPWNFGGSPAPTSSQHQQSPLPSFSDLAGNIDFEPREATTPIVSGAPHTPHELNSDDFLSALADGNFSSPSSYPQSATQASLGTTQQTLQDSRPQVPIDCLSSGTILRQARLPDSNPLAATTNNSTLQNTSAASTTPAAVTHLQRTTLRPSFLDREVEESLFVSSDDEPEDIMPVQTRRRASTIISSDQEAEVVGSTTSRKRAAPSSAPSRGTAASTKRQRTSQPDATHDQTASATAPQRTVLKIEDDDDVFGDSKEESKKAKADDSDIIDLAASNEVPQELLVPQDDKRVKLSAFQCVICMDDVTALTVTHCGHLFCSECLHSALNVDATKNKCPICRQKIETKDRGDYTAKTKGYWPLELKLMTVSRKGKQRA